MNPKPPYGSIPEQLEGMHGMTIAAGFFCKTGIIVAADTRYITSKSRKQDGPKVGAVQGKHGSFGIAVATSDGYAAKSLLARILMGLENTSARKFSGVESLVEKHMKTWWAAFGRNKPPDIQFVLGAVLKGVPRLYFCEPPNTVYHDADYVGVGSGANTMQSLVGVLFPGYDYTVRQRLWQIAYLFYRAKKEDAFCGGHTMPIYLPTDGRGPQRVAVWDMEAAEQLGQEFDGILRDCLTTHFDVENERMKSVTFSPADDSGS